MCGIFGVVCASDDRIDRELARSLVVSLLRFSETRGREAVGIAAHEGERIEVLKQAGSVTDFLKTPRLHQLLDRALDEYEAGRKRGAGRALAIVGHSRLATNGTQSNADNNQPVITRGSVALHNGIIVNDKQLAARYPEAAPQADLDSEVLAALLRSRLDDRKDLVGATRSTFAELEGAASIAMLFDNVDALLLATNTGSLFQLRNEDGTVMAFASERFILQRVLEDERLTRAIGPHHLEQLKAGHAVAVHLGDLRPRSEEQRLNSSHNPASRMPSSA
jgi:glucosamine 6-phosphate synthetase-like amidotransferase/phosphosugar isomerase protein